MGYIITWHNSDASIKGGASSQNKVIMIDGQQRITALRAALEGESVKTKDYTDDKIVISFNPLTEEFKVRDRSTERGAAWIADISTIIRDTAFSTRRFIADYHAKNPELTEEELDEVDGRISRLLNIRNKQVGAIELCEKRQQANKFKVLTLAWLHDYEKIIDFDNQYNTELKATRGFMHQLGFKQDFIDEVSRDLNIYNAKDNLQAASIEIQIVSSSDAASHFVGPFMSLYWYENPDMSVEELMDANIHKISVDWEKKITLPEVKDAFKKYRNFNLQAAGELPNKYLKN